MRLVLLSILLLLSACATGPDSACRPEKLAELPLSIVSNVPVLTVQINGQPAALVLDTGSDATVLTHAAARRLGIAETASSRQVRGAGGAATVGRAVIDSLAVGSIPLARVPVLTADSPAPPLDGLLGIDVLIDFEVELDVPHRRAAFYRARSCVAAAPDWAGRIIALPVQQQPSGHLFVSVAVDGQPLRGMLDSGASRSVLSLQSAADTGLRRRTLEALPGVRGQAVNPEGLVARQAQFRQLSIGTDVVANPRLTIADLPPFAGDLLVGADYIGSRRMWFSFRLGRVFVAPDPN